MKVANLVNTLGHQVTQVSGVSLLKTLDVFWDISRRYFYTLAFWSLIGAKILHLYAHLFSLSPQKFLLWGPSFFYQDVLLLLLLRICVQRLSGPIAVLCALFVIPFSIIVSGMSAANFSVYVFTGAEIHWRQAKTFAGDGAAVRTLLTGLTGFLIGEALLVAGTVFTARYIHTFTGGVLHVLAWPCRWVLARLSFCLDPLLGRLRRRFQREQPLPDPRRYEQISLEDDYLNDSGDEDEGDYFLDNNHANITTAAELTNRRPSDRLLPRLLVIAFMISAVILRSIRPAEPVYLYLSGTLPLSMFFEGGTSRYTAIDISALPWNYNYLVVNSSLAAAPDWDWMTKQAGPGFEDWKKGSEVTEATGLHYDPHKSPLHISNLKNPVLESISNALTSGDVKIKHVILLKLESARADIFPLRKDSFMYRRIEETYADKKIPSSVNELIANLTPTAERLTGFPTGFDSNDTLTGNRKPYGGIAAKNAYTTSTLYSEKSCWHSLRCDTSCG
ncbi:sulfatase domain protein [Penicillium chermesinum]|nr:sulfatase domain protein [Penicillium chermesinum]